MAITFETVRDVIVREMGVKQEEVTPTAYFVDDLGADSLDELELVMALEETFELEIDEQSEEVARIRTVAEAVTYLQSLKPPPSESTRRGE